MSARSQIKAILNKLLSPHGGFVTAKTPRSDLQSLMQSLYPLKTDQSLIRLGPQGDGGYLLPDDLEGIQACFSPGVSQVSGFEKDCADRGMKAFLADKSVERPTEHHELFDFKKQFIGAMSNDDFITLDDWADASLQDSVSDLLLQIDIEGYEYEVFLSLSERLFKRFRIIVAEFHQLDQLANRAFFNMANRVFHKILQTHACVHIHPNNYEDSVTMDDLEIPKVMEFTFYRRDRLTSQAYQTTFPHQLDVENCDAEPLLLPACWYAKNG